MTLGKGTRSTLIAAIFGCLLRIVLVISVVPTIQTEWFVPFFETFVAHPSIDPWETYLAAGGELVAFPYGPVMVLYFGLTSVLTAWLPSPWGIQVGMATGLLLLEVLLWALAARWFPACRNVVLVLFACSPIAVYASYIHGQLDLLPTLLIFFSAFFMSKKRWYAAGLIIGFGIAAKFSVILVPPLIVVFLLRNARYRHGLSKYLLGLIPGTVLTLIPVLLPGYRQMVLETPTSQSVLVYAAEIGPGLTIVILPVVYAALLAVAYRMKRGNPDLIFLIIGITLTAVTLLTPASPGWYLWSVPFLVVLAARTHARRALTIVWAFWAVATVTLALRASSANWRFSDYLPLRAGFDEVGPFVNQMGTLGAVLSTATVGLGVAALVMLYGRCKREFDVYRLSRAPLAVAIAGDSGTGKDTLSVSLTQVFGDEATTFVMGDDYHLHDRQAALWRVTTHLHPGANDLSGMAHDAVALMRGERTRSRHYDHSRGRFGKSEVVEPRELVVVNGLHSLVPAEIRSRADVTIYTSMDESLRRRLKIDRDVGERGVPLERVVEAIERRYDHARRFIQPQADLADVVLHLEPVMEMPAEDVPLERQPQLRLIVTLRHASFVEKLHGALISVGNCQAQLRHLDEPGTVQLIVYPDGVTASDTAAIAHILIDRHEELFLNTPRWRGESVGMIQLIAVLALLDRRISREDAYRP